ncbi:MAG TPA: RNB domain-containing ribonuclease [Solirubrobacteraceae bacterium]
MKTPSAPAGIVAVLEKRGRFWAAEPLFGMPQDAQGGPPRRRAGRIALGARLAGEGAARARVGDLVLVGPARSARGGRGDARRPGRGGHPGAATILRVIGRPDVARDTIEGLMLHRGLARRFDPAIEHEARSAARERGLGQRGRDAAPPRRDLRELATFTIDPPSARDFDDAISAERIGEEGRIRIWVHIADVSAYVLAGSPLDREARRRGTSVYVPGAVEPMLPQALSGDACSLVPGQDRAAVTVELELDGAQIQRVAFHRSVIRSDERLDYERVDRIFAGRERAAEPWAQPLQLAREAARSLGEARARRSGALTLESSEPEFRFDAEGHVLEVGAGAVQTESHRLIEHLMIAANEAVAQALERQGAPCLYRVHERPQPARVERLLDQLVSLGVPTPPLPEGMSSTQAAELMGQISKRLDEHLRRATQRAGDGSAVGASETREAAPAGGRRALTSLVLRALQQAYYSPSNLGHAGLGSLSYCHFTSPIRRYPDLVCHRALLALIGAGEAAPRAADLAELGAWSSERERAAMEIERDADDVARCFGLERVLYERGWRETFDGEVVGLIPAGAFVAFGEEGRYEGMLPVRRLAGARREEGRDWWDLNEQGTILRAERSGDVLRLGDPIAVQVARVETARGRVDLVPAERDGPSAGAPSRNRTARSRRS